MEDLDLSPSVPQKGYKENPFDRMGREYAFQETIMYNYTVWLTIKYEKQFSDFKNSKRPGKVDWWHFIETLPLDVEDEITYFVYIVKCTSVHSFDPLPSKTKALETLVRGPTDRPWIQIIEDVYKHRQEIEKQKDLIKELFFIL